MGMERRVQLIGLHLRKTTRSNLRMIKFSSIMCKSLLMLSEKSRVKGDFQARFCERLGLKCPCLLDSLPCAVVGAWPSLAAKLLLCLLTNCIVQYYSALLCFS